MTEQVLRPLDRRGLAKLDYPVCVQFLLLHLACLLVFLTGYSAAAVAVCVALYFVRMFAITAGFHRLFSHRTYKSGRVFRFLMAFLGTAAYQKGPLWWSAHHRRHHLHVETDGDAHSPISQSVWTSHVGWFMLRENRATDHRLVSNLLKYPDLRFLDRFYLLPPAALAAATFLLGLALERYAPGLGTNAWQMFVWGFLVSTVLLYHGTFTVNSVAHLFGSRRFETKDNSRNNLLVALITLGEGWHNNHHYYPTSERQGFRWWELDMAHYTLRVLSWFGVVWDLRTPPGREIQASPTRAETTVSLPEEVQSAT